MSIAIYPHIEPAELKLAVEDTQRRELGWLLDELRATLVDFKHGLEDCYALLAPVDPGSTLVVSTPRNEAVKGHVTRVGTRLVKGTLSLRLRTLPAQTLALDPAHPIHLAPLVQLHARLTDGLDLLARTLELLPPSAAATGQDNNPVAVAAFVAAQLRLLASTLHDAAAQLRGPPLNAPDRAWTTLSAAPTHFTVPAAPHPPSNLLAAAAAASSSSADHHHQHHHSLRNLSVYFSVQDAALVLWVRALEPADAAPSLGMKLALAIGTARRLEHDESELVFGYCCAGLDGRAAADAHGPASSPTLSARRPATASSSASASEPVLSGTRPGRPLQVLVREKVRVETADPSLLSLSAKLNALSHTLATARRNLAAVMGEELDD